MADCRFFMIASCDDDGAVSGSDRSRWGHPTRREAASVFPRLGRSRDGEANSFRGRAGAAPGALSKAIAHHLRRHGRGCSRAIARCLPIRACVASAGRFVEWSSVVRYSIFHRKTLVRKNQVSQSAASTRLMVPLHLRTRQCNRRKARSSRPTRPSTSRTPPIARP